MKKTINKKAYLILPIFALLTSCSYGVSSMISHNEFKSFYENESGGLTTQKNRLFSLGESINIKTVTYDTDGIITKELVADTDSNGSWSLTNGDLFTDGEKLSFNNTEKKTDEDNKQVYSNGCQGFLNHASSTIETDEDKKNNISYDVESYEFYLLNEDIVGEENDYQTINKEETTNSYTVTKKNSYNKETSEIYVSLITTQWYSKITKNVLDYETFENGTIRKTEIKNTYEFNYVKCQNIDDNSIKFALTYSNSEKETITDTLKDTGGNIASSTITQTYVVEVTSFDDTKEPAVSETGSKRDQYYVSNYDTLSGDYIIDNNVSTDTTDDNWRFEVTNEYVSSLERDQMLTAWRNLSELTSCFDNINTTYQGLFTQFENEFYATDVSSEEEIVLNGRNYAYRIKLDDLSSAGNPEILQFLFLDGKTDEDASKLTKVSLFEMVSNVKANLLQETTLIFG